VLDDEMGLWGEFPPRNDNSERDERPRVWVASQIRAAAGTGDSAVFVEAERNTLSDFVYLKVESGAIVDKTQGTVPAVPDRVAILHLSNARLLQSLARALMDVADCATRQWAPRKSS
jgi:hypothetical protein